ERQLMELNNGRLAMVAFFGLVFQDMATGDYGPVFGTPDATGVANGTGNFDGIELFKGLPFPKSPGGITPNVYPPVGFLSYDPPPL
ncbi:unnamed protein product, partial [Prorocentrum cordatum]